jgi:hypothetical protein
MIVNVFINNDLQNIDFDLFQSRLGGRRGAGAAEPSPTGA